MNINVLTKIDKYLSIDEVYSKSMLDVFPADMLKRLSRSITIIGIDIAKSEFTEIPKESTSAGKMKDKLIICYFKSGYNHDSPEYAIIGTSDEGKNYGILASSSHNFMYKNKKQAIENADRIFVVTKANGVSNYDIRKFRQSRKQDATALDRNVPTKWASDLDKSGYDLQATRDALKQRLYTVQKNAKTDKVMNTFRELANEISDFLMELSNGKIPSFNNARKMNATLKLVSNVVEKISLYKENIPSYVMDDLEKSLGLK